MLYTGPITYDQSDSPTKVYRELKPESFDVEAFHWGSLTAGHWTTAFWILLAPFALGNVAGWMGRPASRWSRFWVRMAALALTALFVIELLIVAIDIPLTWAGGTSDPARTVQLLVLATFLFLLIVIGRLSTQSHFSHLSFVERFRLLFDPRLRMLLPKKYRENPPEDQWIDPGNATVADEVMWDVHASVNRLRRLHLGLTFLVIAAVVAVGLDDVPWAIGALVGIGVIVLLLLWTTIRAEDRVLHRLTAWVPVASVAVLGMVILRIANGLPDGPAWPHIHKFNLYTAMAMGVSAAMIPLGEFVARIRGATQGTPPSLATAILPAGAITIGALIGTSFGIAAALIAERAFDVHHVSDNGAEWVAVAMLGLVLWMAIVGLVLSRKDDPRLPPGTFGENGSGLRRIVLKGRGLIYAAAIYGLAVGVVAYREGCQKLLDCDPARLGTWPEGLTVDLGQINLFGFGFNIGDPADIAKALLILGPAFFVVQRLFLGARDLSRRRQIGILWDVGSFWPRAFHPLGPPAYGPNAVSSLRAAVKNPGSAYRVIDPEAPADPAVRLDVLSAHSQGTLVAAVAMNGLTDSELPKSFLTYGSQLGILYPRMFPASGIEQLVDSLHERLTHRWINLWRDSDPIGGQPATQLQEANWRVETGTGHSRYELTPEFCQARKNLRTGNTERPPQNSLIDCWNSP
jgi:hypothetical protein